MDCVSEKTPFHGAEWQNLLVFMHVSPAQPNPVLCRPWGPSMGSRSPRTGAQEMEPVSVRDLPELWAWPWPWRLREACGSLPGLEFRLLCASSPFLP